LADLSAQDLLSHMQSTSSCGEPFVVGDRLEIAQMPELNIHRDLQGAEIFPDL
jgi:hypothetical protein